MAGSWRRRCDARAKHKTARAAGDWRTAFRHCRNWAVPGKTRCHLHGGLSTGPKTPEGKAASLAASLPAMLEGRRRRIAELAAQGKRGGEEAGVESRAGIGMRFCMIGLLSVWLIGIFRCAAIGLSIWECRIARFRLAAREILWDKGGAIADTAGPWLPARFRTYGSPRGLAVL